MSTPKWPGKISQKFYQLTQDLKCFLIPLLNREAAELGKEIQKLEDEVIYLRWCRIKADFGPASGDIEDSLKRYYIRETKNNIPEGWNYWSSGKQITEEEFKNLAFGDD